MPTRGTQHAAGWDLHSPIAVDLWADETPRIIDTHVHVELPPGWCGLVLPRSSLTARGIVACMGVIDSDYRGSIRVALGYRGETPEVIAVGDRIAQLVITRVHGGELELVQSLSTTSRGAGGFGSTGR